MSQTRTTVEYAQSTGSLAFIHVRAQRISGQPCCDIRKEVAMASVLQPRNLIPNTEPPAGKSFKDLIKQVSAIVKPHSV